MYASGNDRHNNQEASNGNNTGPDEHKQENIIRAIPFKPFDETTLRRRSHLYAKHYQRGQCTATIGCDGAGKSTVGIAEAVCMATARDLLS